MNTIIEKIRAEVLRLIRETDGPGSQYGYGKMSACNRILNFLDTLQEQPVCEDLESYAQRVEDYYDVGEERGYLCTHRGDIKNAVIAGAEWAMHYQEKKIADAYEKGKQEGIRVVRSWESSPGQGGY